jgi:c-di-GMP-binding flagellar brake protein YcgR
MTKFSLYDGDERRSSERVKARFVVTYKLGKPLEVSFFIYNHQAQGLMLDLSQEGMALLTAYNIPETTTLLMNFTLINMSASNEADQIKTIDLTGEVRYVRKAPKKEYRLGIRFLHVNKEDRDTLSEFVRTVE